MLKKPFAAATWLMDEKGPTERFFGAHAEGYAKSQSHAHGRDLGTLVDALRPKPVELALDVATGTGFTAVALAPHVSHVTGIDVTAEMLDRARRLAHNEGVLNVTFELGNAQATKFADRTYDIVTTRRAAHHFQDVPKFLREAYRVLRPKGRLGLVDMSPPEGTEVFCNQIERLRDGSHAEAFTPNAWKSMVAKAGFRTRFSEVIGEHVTFERWLYPVELGGEVEAAVRAAWRSAGQETRRQLNADYSNDVKSWKKSRIVLVAVKTS